MPQPKPSTEQKPEICRMVIYRTRDGVDVPAVITHVIDAETGDVHLQPFIPPGVAPDPINYQFGVAFEGNFELTSLFDEDDHARMRWRWPERS